MVDAIDKRILFELEKNARISDVKLAKIIRKSKDTVRYRIKRLEEQGIIQEYRMWIDFTKLGFRTVTFYLRTKNLSDRIEKLKQQIGDDPRAYWLGLAHGLWSVGITYFVQSNEEVLDIKTDLQQSYDDLLIDMKIVFLTTLGIKQKSFLHKMQPKLLFFTEKTIDQDIDSLSWEILDRLYIDATCSLANLALNLDVSVDKIRSRMKRLKENGVIVRFSARIDYHMLDQEFYKTHIYLRSNASVQKLFTYIESQPDMINVVRQIAPWDMEIIHFNRNFQEYTISLQSLVKTFEKEISHTEFAAMYEDVLYPCRQLLRKKHDG